MRVEQGLVLGYISVLELRLCTCKVDQPPVVVNTEVAREDAGGTGGRERFGSRCVLCVRGGGG